MAAKSTAPEAPPVAPKPAPASAPVKEDGPPAIDPKLLVALSGHLADLKAAKEARALKAKALAEAQDAHDGAVARVEMLHKALLGDLVGLSAGDLADNFLYLSDAEAAALTEAAKAARKDPVAFAKAKLAG